MDPRQNRDALIDETTTVPLSDADFLVSALTLYTQQVLEELNLVNRETFLQTASSPPQVFRLAANLLYTPQRVDTYKVQATLCLYSEIKKSTIYSDLLTYAEGSIVQHKNNLYEKKAGAVSVLGEGWREFTPADSDRVLEPYTQFTAGSLSYFNADRFVLSRGTSILNATLYEGTLREEILTADGVDFQQHTLQHKEVAESTLTIYNPSNDEIPTTPLAELSTTLDKLLTLTLENSTVVVVDPTPSAALLNNAKARYLTSSQEAGFIASNTLAGGVWFVQHEDAADYAPAESLASIRAFAPSTLGGRTLTSLQRTLNFLTRFYTFSNVQPAYRSSVLYTAVTNAKTTLSSSALSLLEQQINNNRVISTSFIYEAPLLVPVCLIGSVTLKAGVPLTQVVASSAFEGFNMSIKFDTTFSLQKMLEQLIATNLYQQMSLQQCLVQEASLGAPGSSVSIDLPYRLATSGVFLVGESNKVLTKDLYAADLSITTVPGSNTIIVSNLSLRYANKEVTLLLSQQDSEWAPEVWNQLFVVDTLLTRRLISVTS